MQNADRENSEPRNDQPTEDETRIKVRKTNKLVSFLYNNNPFYLISAGVILYGIHSAFGSGAFNSGALGSATLSYRVSLEETADGQWVLAALIAAYTTLLAATAWLIVRFGKVWDDARAGAFKTLCLRHHFCV